MYERENMFFIKSIGSLPDSFLNGNYLIEWKENKAIIILNDGTENEEISEFMLKNNKK